MDATLDSRRADLHFHLLPGLDDGPDDLAESLDLARRAVADGSGTVVATPHVREDFVTNVLALPELVRELRLALQVEEIPLELRCGGEVGHRMVGRLRQDELETIAQGPAGARWILVESPFEGIGDDFHAATDELRDRGFGVVLAHPERSADAALDGLAGVRRELAAGAVAQVNALSLAGAHGPAAFDAADQLLAEGLVTLVGSDAHGPTRPPALTVANDVLVQRGVPAAAARLLVGTAPRGLLTRGLRARTAVAA